jgi:arylsulfatase A-like enzyme/Flp pilus assembly protein TadD
MAALLIGLLHLLAACGGSPAPLRTGRVPVILISVDTLRSDRLPAYGYDAVETPHLDRLAADSVLFERAYSHYPMTLPSHSSMLTGKLPPDHGVRDNRGYRLGDDVPTLASTLSEAGYATGGVVSSSVLRRQTGIGHGFEFYNDTVGGGHDENLRVFPQRPGARTIAIAEEWLDGLPPDEPFFLFLHLFEPHTPYDAPEPFRSRFADPYDAEVAYTDELVGGVLDDLVRRGLYDDALILFVSDHGEGLGDHGETEHGLLLYREALQVPLMIKLPGGARAGERVATPVGLIDLMPTVLDLLELPTGQLEGFALFGPEQPPADRPIYSETWFPRHQYGWSDLASAIEGELHYIRAPRPELFDLVADPAERDDLIGRREPPEDVEGWLAEVGAGIEATAEMSEEELEALAALGYIGGASDTDDREMLADPKDHVAEVEEMWSLIGRVGTSADAAEERRILELANGLGVRNEALYRTIAGNLLRAGRPGFALEVMAPYRNTDDTATRLLIGKALSEVGEIQPALREFEAVLERNPDDADAHLGMGIALLTVDRPGMARPHLERAVELDATLADGWNALGVVLARSGNPAAAEPLWKRAVQLDPTLSDTWFNLALLHHQMGRIDEAIDDLQHHVELVNGPERQRAEAMLRELRASSGSR